jgi:ribosomal protein S18 acetylase RimI-like enzyme
VKLDVPGSSVSGWRTIQLNYILEDLSQEAVIDAIEGNLSSYFHCLAGGSARITFHDEGDVKWFVSGVPFPLLNGATSAKLDPESANRRIDEILGEFKAAQMPMLWWAGPATRPQDIGSRLAARGLMKAGAPPGMAMDLMELDGDEAPPSGVTIKRLDSDDMLEGYKHVLLQAFGAGVPDFVVELYFDIFKNIGYDEGGDVQNYLAYLEGTPVGACTVAYGAGVAGIYNVATVEEARGRGIGRAVTLRPLLDARERGYRVGVLESSELGYNVYKRLGFKDYGPIEQYLFMPTGG